MSRKSSCRLKRSERYMTKKLESLNDKIKDHTLISDLYTNWLSRRFISLKETVNVLDYKRVRKTEERLTGTEPQLRTGLKK